MTIFSRSFVRKRLVSLATTTLVATASLAFAHNPMSSYHVPGAMPIQYVNERPDYHEESPFLSENDVAINRMMADMTVKPTGDTDRDFVALMVPLNRGTVDMVQAEITHGHNEQLRQLAQRIIATRQQEIDAAGKATDRWFGASATPFVICPLALCSPAIPVQVKDEVPHPTENDAAMNRMMADMVIKPTGDVDRDFVSIITPHHRGAIEMAQAVLHNGHNEQIRQLAREFITTRQQEIAAMRLALTPSPQSPMQVDQDPVVQLQLK